MSKELPYMQFYPSDWLADCHILSLEARGAWQSIICKAWNSQNPGVVEMNLGSFSKLFGENLKKTQKAIKELECNGIANISYIGDKIRIVCRRIERDFDMQVSKSQLRMNAGRKGGEAKFAKHVAKAKSWQNPSNAKVLLKQIETETEAKADNIIPLTPKGELGLVNLHWGNWQNNEAESILCSRLSKMMNRRETTSWNKKEIAALKLFIKNVKWELNDIERLEWYYNKSGCEFLRRDMLTLLNNLSTEIERAHAYGKSNEVEKPKQETFTDKRNNEFEAKIDALYDIFVSAYRDDVFNHKFAIIEIEEKVPDYFEKEILQHIEEHWIPCWIEEFNSVRDILLEKRKERLDALRRKNVQKTITTETVEA